MSRARLELPLEERSARFRTPERAIEPSVNPEVIQLFDNDFSENRCDGHETWSYRAAQPKFSVCGRSVRTRVTDE